MHETDYVIARIREGAKVRFFIDYFGRESVVVPRRYFMGKKRCTPDTASMQLIKRELDQRRRARTTPQLSS